MKIKRNFFILFVIIILFRSASYGQVIDYSSFGIEIIDNQIPRGLKAG